MASIDTTTISRFRDGLDSCVEDDGELLIPASKFNRLEAALTAAATTGQIDQDDYEILDELAHVAHEEWYGE